LRILLSALRDCHTGLWVVDEVPIVSLEEVYIHDQSEIDATISELRLDILNSRLPIPTTVLPLQVFPLPE